MNKIIQFFNKITSNSKEIQKGWQFKVK